MLARIYNNPHNKEANQSRLEKILQFWASKEVYDQATIASLESEMTGGLPLHSASQKETPALSDPTMFTGLYLSLSHLHKHMHRHISQIQIAIFFQAYILSKFGACASFLCFFF